MNEMATSVRKVEIMAPAGDWISLQAAINAGADAVYFGLSRFNMRASAKNFPSADLPRIVKTCHEKGVKAYLTLNTIIYESEITAMHKLMRRAAQDGVDAVICWDFSVIRAAKDLAIPVFVSTQMSVSNSESLLYLHKNCGIKRFVLARECSVSDIRQLKKAVSESGGQIEIEVFVHGAMCVSISGRCFMSQFNYGESANRGECRQPCRREYLISDAREGRSFIIGRNYVMSPKDLCSLPFLDKILAAGADALKIEGRGRSPEYVETVTSAYRRAVDYYYDNLGNPTFKKDFQHLISGLYKEVNSVYNRGFSSGFYLGFPLDQWSDGDGTKASRKKVYIGIVNNYFRKPGVAEIKVENLSFTCGDELVFQGPSTGVQTQTVETIELDGKRVGSAKKGLSVTIKVLKRVRKGDKIYMMQIRDKCEKPQSPDE